MDWFSLDELYIWRPCRLTLLQEGAWNYIIFRANKVNALHLCKNSQNVLDVSGSRSLLSIIPETSGIQLTKWNDFDLVSFVNESVESIFPFSINTHNLRIDYYEMVYSSLMKT